MTGIKTKIPEGLRASQLFETQIPVSTSKRPNRKNCPQTVFQALPEHNAPMQAQHPDKKEMHPDKKARCKQM